MRAPMRASTSSNPVRRGLRPTSWIVSSDPGSRVAATTKAPPRRSRPARRPRRAEAARPDRRRPGAARAHPHAGGLEHQLGVVARRQRLDDRRLAGRVEAREQHARLDLRARHRQLVADPAQLAARDHERRRAVVALDARAHLPSGSGDPVDRAAAQRSSPVSSKLPCWPARIPASSRSVVPELPQSIGASGSRRPRRPAPWMRSESTSSSSHGHAERAHRGDRRLGVARAAEAANRGLALADRPEQHGPVRDRLVARNRDVAAQRAGRLDLHSASTGETTTP